MTADTCGMRDNFTLQTRKYHHRTPRGNLDKIDIRIRFSKVHYPP